MILWVIYLIVGFLLAMAFVKRTEEKYKKEHADLDYSMLFIVGVLYIFAWPAIELYFLLWGNEDDDKK